MRVPLTLVQIFAGGSLLGEKSLPPGEYILGHDLSAPLNVSAPGVRAKHALLRLRHNEWMIEDLGDGGGTYVNGEQVRAAHVVYPSQRITVGTATIFLTRLEQPGDAEDEELDSPRATVRELLPRNVLGKNKYEIGPKVAEGGMGIILDAHEAPVQRNVAMKKMGAMDTSDDVRRFIQEAQITAQLEHPNIVPVHELGVDELEQPFYTMKYVRGVALDEVLTKLAAGVPDFLQKYSLSTLLTIFQKVCDAVAFAHSKGVLHRDIKPGNIMIGDYGEALMMDWGLAKMMGEEHAVPDGATSPAQASDDPMATIPAVRTETGVVVGTYPYMPPEQAEGRSPELNETADIYALGAVLHHILTLRAPVEGKDDATLRDNVINHRLLPLAPPPGKKLAHLPGGRIPTSLKAIVRKAMAANREDRYPTVKALQADLAKYQNGFAPSAEEAGVLKRGSLAVLRHPTVSSAVVLIAIASMISAAIFAVAREREHLAERIAYVSDILEAGRYLLDGRTDSVRELLSDHEREATGRDLRGWEWHYLDSQLRDDRLQTFAHEEGVYAIAASPDGSRLATGGGDGHVAFWESSSLRPVSRIAPAHTGSVLAVAWEPGGAHLASGGADGMVCVWEVATGRKVAEVKAEGMEGVRALAWQPKVEGERILTIGGNGETVESWSPLSANPPPAPVTLFITEGGVAGLQWSTDGQRLALAKFGTTTTAQVWDSKTRNIVFKGRPYAGEDLLSAAFDRVGNRLAVGTKHFEVVIFDTESGERTLEKLVHRGVVRAVTWSPDEQEIASASQDGTIRIIRPGEPDQPPKTFCGHVGEVAALVWTHFHASENPQQKREALFSGGADGTLRAWLPRSPETSGFKSPNANWIAAARWSPDGKSFAVTDFRSHIYIVDRASGVSLPLCSLQSRVMDVAWSPSGDRLLACSRMDQAVEVFEVKTGKIIGSFQKAEVDHVSWSSSGRYFMASGREGTATWEAASGRQIASTTRATGAFTWLADERRVLLGCTNGALEVWDAHAGKWLATWRPAQKAPAGALPHDYEPPSGIFTVKLSPDQQLIAFGTVDRVLSIISARDGSVVRTFPGHTGGIRDLAWSPDMRRLATCSEDGSARVFDVQTGDMVARLEHGSEGKLLHTIDWSRDGRQILTGGYDTMVRIWDASRSYEMKALAKSERATGEAANLQNLLESAQRAAHVGLASNARAKLAKAAPLARNFEDAEHAAQAIETLLDKALSGGVASSAGRAHQLLQMIHDQLDARQIQNACDAYRELVALEPGNIWTLKAKTFFSRGRWSATFFPTQHNPVSAPDQWRADATGEDAITVPLLTMSLPYAARPPRELPIHPKLIARGPAQAPFGMIARGRPRICNGEWTWKASGAGWLRISVGGEVVLERSEEDGPFEISKTIGFTTEGGVDVVIEHGATVSPPALEISLEPEVP